VGSRALAPRAPWHADRSRRRRHVDPHERSEEQQARHRDLGVDPMEALRDE
jgi:hypothetical protein